VRMDPSVSRPPTTPRGSDGCSGWRGLETMCVKASEVLLLWVLHAPFICHFIYKAQPLQTAVSLLLPPTLLTHSFYAAAQPCGSQVKT
jgi:hypothetical protein